MVNLIQQHDQLKGLGDDELQGEASNPSGSVPPFLVLTEINRRKRTRDAYAAQQARQKPSTTVAEDLLSAPLGSPGRVAMGRRAAPQGGGEIGIAAALPQGAPDVPAFAEGGLVRDDILSRIAQRRTASLEAVDSGRDDLFGRSLIAGGAAMMSRGSANFMKNVGAGLSGGLEAWDSGSQILDSREAEALNGLAGVHESEEAARLAALDEQFRRDQEARLASQFTTEVNRPTAAMQNHEYLLSLPESERPQFLDLEGGGAAGDNSSRRYAMNAFAKVVEDQRKAVTESYKYALAGAATPEEQAAVQAEIDAEVQRRAAAEFSGLYPDYAALMPELTAGAPGGTPSTAAPAGVIDYTEL